MLFWNPFPYSDFKNNYPKALLSQMTTYSLDALSGAAKKT